MAFHLVSDVFQQSNPIPKEYTGEGENQSPPLTWEDVPSGAKQLALICDDPDAPQDEPFVHWVAYNIPPSLKMLQAAVPNKIVVDAQVHFAQGANSFGKYGYGGPMPPKGHGTHHYHFKLYALDKELQLMPGLSKEELLEQIKEHILAETELVGTYVRH